MSDVYPSNQVAELLQVSPATLRTWKSRKSDQLLENVHWFLSEGQTFWTTEGLEALKLIQNTVAVKAKTETGETDTSETSETDTVSDPFQRYSQLINAVADAVTPGLLQRIDNTVMGKVKTALATPMTSAECVNVLTELGLTPADPASLAAENVAGLLEAKEI